MNRRLIAIPLSLVLSLATPVALGSCGSNTTEEAVSDLTTTALADGTYEIAVTTDSSMFRSDHCTLTVSDGTYRCRLTLPGEGFSRLFFGTSDEAAQAADDQIYDYYLDEEGKYTFDLPVAALDEDLAIAAYGQRRDTWYDHTISFASPADAASKE